MSPRICLIVLFLLQLLLLGVVAELNGVLGQAGLHLRCDVLLVLFSGFYLSVGAGFTMTLLLALISGAALPLIRGEYLLSLLLCWLTVVWMRLFLKRERARHIFALALSLQTTVMLGLTLRFHEGLIMEWRYLQSLLLNWTLNAAFLALVAYPWCEFQRRLLHGLGWDLNAESKTLAAR